MLDAGREASGEWLPWSRPERLRGQIEENLRQLGRDRRDVVNLRIYGPAPTAEHFGAPAELREKGLIRHLGPGALGLTPEELSLLDRGLPAADRPKAG